MIDQGIFPNGKAYAVRRLAETDVPAVLRLQDIVVGHLADESIFQPLTEEEYRYITGGKGLMIGVFADGELISFRALLVPYTREGHLGIDAGLREEELDHVIYQDISSVHPDWRGMGLQRRMADWIMEELAHTDHPYQYVCATVAPFNIASLKDKFAQGMEIAALKPKYGGHLRYIFIKQLAERPIRDGAPITCPMDDIEGQQRLLAEGCRGQKMEVINGVYHVVYRK